MAVQYFPDVTVGFPQGGVARSGTQDWNSTATAWVIWTTGELRLETASLALFFTPPRQSAKPLGCLLTAVPMASASPNEGMSFIVTTNDPVHSVMRLGFNRQGDEDTFAAIAKAAAGSRFESITARRSSVRPSIASPSAINSAADELTMHIRQRHPDKMLALVFGGCELYGPQPGGDQGVEVLLGRGAVALLDPIDTNRVGNFELVFYDEGSPEAMLRAGVGARMRLTPQPQEDRRLSLASRRVSARPLGAGMAFDFSTNGHDALAFSFDDEATGDSFLRDLTVRVKLAALSQKTWRGKQAMADLQGEIQTLQSRGLLATLRRWLCQALLVCFILFLLHMGSLYMAEPERPLQDIAEIAFSDAVHVASTATTAARDASSTVCQMAGGAVSALDLEKCSLLQDSAEIKECINGLTSSARLSNLGNFGSNLGAVNFGAINLNSF
eukprot:TRINITY_DN38797_c0_g1_i1.p1 TRINITY_DN38797_c0_g1~~TRINITY_DN38797_c0_g1_i1.p1  ORF type:complete len:442 (+),score=90.93 TRINITY_DN38797_c0_g1_i1:59-1384(+)